MTTPHTFAPTLSPTEALELLRPALMAAPRCAPARANLPESAYLVLSLLPELSRLRPTLAAMCGQERAAVLDQLAPCALAVLGASAAWTASSPPETPKETAKVLQRLRALLLQEARLQLTRGAVSPGALAQLRGTSGYGDLCLDALQLVMILTPIAATSGLLLATAADLRRAETLVDRLTKLTGEQARGTIDPAADLCDRAFHLLATTYDEVRRMVSYVRWHERDVDTLCPSLWAQTRKNRARNGAPKKSTSPERKDATEADSTR